MPSVITSCVNITDNLQQIHHKIEEICLQYQRDPSQVKLLAVSKTKPIEDIRQAYQAGQLDFGENYLQEALEKILALEDLPLCWHFIGSIQSNKTREIAEHFDWVHSVDRLKIAKRLNDQRPESLAPLNICLQINISHEASKSGLDLSQLEQLVVDVLPLSRLRLRGIMAIPEKTTHFEEQRQYFAELYQAYHQLQLKYPQLDTLSMGMSGDMQAAIAEGSTLLRIGTAIFGTRNT